MGQAPAAGQPELIRIEGRVLIGSRLEDSMDGGGTQPRFDPTPGLRSYRGPRARQIAPNPGVGSGPVAFMQPRFRETAEPIAIEDAGLTTCYGIFGNPGMGKTHLLMLLLKGILGLHCLDREKRFGALILDPKGTLIKDVMGAAAAAGRTDDVRVVTTTALAESRGGMNVLDAPLSGHEMALALVLAAQSADKSASDPYWCNAWASVFMAAAELLPIVKKKLTMANLVDVTIRQGAPGGSRPANTPGGSWLATLLREARDEVPHLATERRRSDALSAIDRVEMHLKQKGETAATINVIVAKALGEFQRSEYRACYSSEAPSPLYSNLYDQIVNDGRIVVVSFSEAERAFSRILVTLIKTLFQITILNRYERSRGPNPQVNFQRPVLFMCDEYQDAATELAGEPVGDAWFFQKARQVGCMGLVATQSVSGMIQRLPGDGSEAALNAIMASFASTFFFQSNDPQTRKRAVDMAGQADAYVVSASASYGGESPSLSVNRQIETRSRVQESRIASLERGQALVVGTLNNDTQTLEFIKTPKPEPEEPGALGGNRPPSPKETQ